MFIFKPVKVGKLKFERVQYHRNGISGTGFWCAVVHDPENGDMLITYFDIKGECCIAVYNLALLPNIEFGENSWRGDNYVDAMKQAIEEYKHQREVHYNIGGEK
jgi:hypothetical protein